jgi:hypothetical protein
MATWLTPAWVDELVALAVKRPPIAGASGVVEITITGGPDGDAVWHWTGQDGGGIEGASGPAAGEADLQLTIGSADARPILDGEVEPSVAFMRGRLKASGDGGLLLAWLASTATDEWDAWRRSVAAATD